MVMAPEPELLVKDNEARASLLVDEVKVSESFPLDKVKFPEVMVSLPEVTVKFLPEATVVSPPNVTLPVEVEKVPVEPEASKFPAV